MCVTQHRPQCNFPNLRETLAKTDSCLTSQVQKCVTKWNDFALRPQTMLNGRDKGPTENHSRLQKTLSLWIQHEEEVKSIQQTECLKELTCPGSLTEVRPLV